MNIVERAVDFAVKAHGEQKRKYCDLPYHVHLAGVARIVASVPHDPEMLAAAWLHDCIEDTSVTPQQLRAEFSGRVVAIVLELTDCDGSIGNRAFRKAHDRARLASASDASKTIKLADLIDNTSSIVEHDKNFAWVYLDEKALLLPCLKDGDLTLWERAMGVLVEAQRQLVQAELEKGQV